MALVPRILHEKAESAIVEVRQDFMVKPFGEGCPTIREAHFLKPTKNQTLPKPPSLSAPADRIIMKKLTKCVLFRCNPRPQDMWKNWVDDLEMTHQSLWKKVGIFDAIRGSTYYIRKDDEMIIELAHHWCPVTNTFVFPWGECTLTLEDVMVLGGFSVLGECVLSPSECREFEEIEVELVQSCSEIRRNSDSNFVTQWGWMNYFKGKGGELEHVAFLVLWLSRYVFPTGSYNVIAPNVFVLAISLAKGVKIALGCAVLASIYRDLTLLKEKIVSLSNQCRDDGLDVVLRAPFQLVQVWIWERFTTLCPKPLSIGHCVPRLARWDEIEKSDCRNLRVGFQYIGGRFLWRPYDWCVKTREPLKSHCDKGIWVLIDSQVDEQIRAFARCLRVSELVGLDCLVQYLPHRVARQFGMDQDIPDSVAISNSDFRLPRSSYDIVLDGLELYLPPRAHEGGVTVSYSDWWRRALSLNVEVMELNERRLRLCIDTKFGHETQARKRNRESLVNSSVPCNSTLLLIDYPGSFSEMPKENSALCGGIVSENRLNLKSEVGEVNVMKPLMSLKEASVNCKFNVTQVKMEQVVNESTILMIEDSKSTNSQEKLVAEDKASSGTVQLIGCETNPLPFTPIEDQDEAEHAITIDEEDENHYPLEALNRELEDRISTLEKTVSKLMTAKLRSSRVSKLSPT